MSELKCCPFCGGELEYSFLLGASECKGCGVMIGFPKLTRHEDKIIATNTRKPMANIVEKLEEESKKKHNKERDVLCKIANASYSAGVEYAINIVKQEIKNELE